MDSEVVWGENPQPVRTVLRLEVAGELVPDVLRRLVDDLEDQHLEDLLADGAEDAALAAGHRLAGRRDHDLPGDAVGERAAAAARHAGDRRLPREVP